MRPDGLNNLTDSDIESIFQHVQTSRKPRAKSLVALAHRQQEVNSSYRPWVTDLIWNVMAPVMGQEFALRHVALPILGGSRLKVLPLVKRPRLVPYDDERPAKPWGIWLSVLPWTIFVGNMVFLLYVASKTGQLDPAGFAVWDGKSSMAPWTADSGATFIVSRLMSRVSGVLETTGTAERLQLGYFLLQLVSPVMFYLVEGYRSGHCGSPLALPVLFLAAMQLFSIGRVAPAYALLHAVLGDTFAAGRAVKAEVAQALVPALTLGYIVPAMFMLMTPVTSSSLQEWAFLWQVSPLVTPALVALYAAGTRWLNRSGLSDKKTAQVEEEEIFEYTSGKDLAALKSAYAYAFAIQATSHILTLAYIHYSSAFSLFDIFLSLPNPLLEEWTTIDIASRAFMFMKYDLAIAAAASLCFHLFMVWRLRSIGYIRSSQAIKTSIAVIMGQVVVGPGATWAGLWYWRENVFARLSWT
jgi:hypothetical protein